MWAHPPALSLKKDYHRQMHVCEYLLMQGQAAVNRLCIELFVNCKVLFEVADKSLGATAGHGYSTF